MTEGLTIRSAKPDDGEMLWHWRNDPAVRQASLSTEDIPLERHLDWYAQSLCNPNREILFAEVHGRPVGMVRFDRDGDTATVSILLASTHRGQGLSAPVLCAAMQASRLACGTFRAVVRPGNAASLALFRSLGFSTVRDHDPIVLERHGVPE